MVQFWPEIAGDFTRSCGLQLQETDQGTFLNVGYAYFVSQPNQLRYDVRDSFEEFLTGITEAKGGAKRIDDRPLAEQVPSLMDQLAEFELMMGTVTIDQAIAQRINDEQPDTNEQQATEID